MPTITEIDVNGKIYPIEAGSDRSLLSVLRNDLDLTGSKYGCGEGQCGACTVLIDGTARRACITPMSATVGKKILTIEGLEQDGKLHPLQEAFLEADALQCGYCTPGMIMAGVGLLSKNLNPTPEEIVRSLNGNICRCGTYQRIIAAVMKAAQALREANP
ncbi:MAG TPA: (2Fe-2S)-binding protein [bacterium]|nr:(2Fe-2S)-binding protein [bacterium]HOL94384.1 (2Fe-2S)-binding protein [bacterium]HPP01968.1 (2Fe-2S)-binding protein [bacterium]